MVERRSPKPQLWVRFLQDSQSTRKDLLVRLYINVLTRSRYLGIRLGTFRFFLLPSGKLEAGLLWLADIKQLLILSYNGIELFLTTFLVSCVFLSTPPPVTTYASDIQPVNTVIEIKTDTVINPLVNTAGTTKAKSVVRPAARVSNNPRMVARPGESQEVIDAIIKTFPDEPVMVEIARCESQLDPSRDRRGIDGGLFQINQVHLSTLKKLGLDRYNLQDNLTYAHILYVSSGLQPWYMSRDCWGKYV